MSQAKRSHKKLIVILVIVAVAAVAFVLFGLPYIQRHFIEVKINEAEAITADKVDLGTDRILTVYFTRNGNFNLEPDTDAVSSASLMRDGDRFIGNCELAARMIQNSVGGSIYAIKTEKKYPSTYSGTVTEAGNEFDSGEKIALADDLPDMSQFDTVFILYPLWWWKVPMAMQSFLQDADLSGKTVHVLVSHGGSGKADSISQLEDLAGVKVSGEVYELFDKDAAYAKDDIAKWLEGLK